MVKNSSEHILELAKELLDDIELTRVAVEPLLLKASRLARWTGSDEIKRWIELELRGYSALGDTDLKFIDTSGRWIDKKEGKLYSVPLAQIAILIDTENIKLKSMSTPDTSGDWAFRVMQMYENNLKDSTANITKLSGIKSKVLAHLHSFITDIYYEKEFDFLSESIFETYKNEVDSLISKNCGSVLEQIPSVMARLSDGNNESISQALITVRRIIDSFADSIYPPSDNTINIDGNDIKLDASKHQNRINAFVHEKIESSSRKRKIRQNLSNLYDRVSTGVHKDVSVEEAKSLFLNTYLLLGEVLHISKIDLK